MDDTTNNTGGFDKGSGGPFNNVCQGDCGGWTSEAAGIGNHIYHTPADRTRGAGGDQWARWRPTIPLPGVYEVWVYVPYSWNATSWQAPYVIETGAGQFTAYGVDQEGLVNRWVCIGAYHFLSGSQAYVYVTDATGETGYTRHVGVDEVKFIQRPTYPAYTPDLRLSGGWMARVIVRNNGSSPADMYMTYLNSSGAVECASRLWGISPNGSVTFAANCTDAVSGVVDASQDVSVVVENSGGGRYNNYNGIGAGGLDPGWGQIGTDVYVPLVKYYDGVKHKTSRFHILNTGSANANITIRGYDTGGSARFTLSESALAPNALWTRQVPFSGYSQLSTWIDSNQPLAVVVAEEQHNSNPNVVYKLQNVFASGDTSIFVPQVKRTSSQFTTLAVQNLGALSTNVTVRYYGGSCSTQSWSVAPKAYHVFKAGDACSSGFVGSARVSGGQPLAVLVNEGVVGVGGERGYSGFLEGSQTVVLPRVRRGSGWWTGIRVMNVDGGNSTSGTINFYNSNGSSAGSASLSISGGYRSVNLGSSVPGSFNGSARITANRPIVVSVIMTLNGSTQQTMMYNGSNR